MAKKTLAAIFACLLLMQTAFAEDSRTFFAMDTVMTIQANGASEELLDACEARIVQLERLFSVTDADSEIALLNRTGRAQLSQDTAELMKFALEMGERTGGALDITMYPIVRAWGFTTGEYRVPGDAEIQERLGQVDYRQVLLDDDADASLPEGMMVDLGSVAKGYASDVLAKMLREANVATGLIDLGGNLYCVGAKQDGSDWRVGVRNPTGDGYCGVLTVRDCAVVTSGSYERYFDAEDGTRYGHIFDPETGRPVSGDLLSATIVGENGTLCDALSTALFVMGSDRAAEYLSAQGEVEAVLLCSDGRILATDGLKNSFKPMGEFAGWEIEWIETEKSE